MSDLYINYDHYKEAYAQGFKDGEWDVYKAGTLVEKDGIVVIEPPNCDNVLVPRELMEQMIQLLNESNTTNRPVA